MAARKPPSRPAKRPTGAQAAKADLRARFKKHHQLVQAAAAMQQEAADERAVIRYIADQNGIDLEAFIQSLGPAEGGNG